MNNKIIFEFVVNKRKIYVTILLLLNILAFYPGIMSNDSFSQYSQAISLSFNDHHPPLMSIWWSFMTLFYQSPSVMLIFHLTMLWTALYLLSKKYDNNYILLIGLLPFVINFSGTLWKDVGLGYSWLLAISIFLTVKNKKYRRILFLMLIFYGVAIRQNALLAAIPVLVYFYYIEYNWGILKSFIITFITIIGFILINNFIVYKVFDSEKRLAGPKILMIHDISGITKTSGNNYFSQEINSKYNTKKIADKYIPSSVGSIFWVKGENFHYIDFNKKTLIKSWLTAISENPILYIRQRWRNFKSLLRIGYSEGYYIFHGHIQKKQYQDIGIEFHKNILYKVVFDYVNKFKESIFMTGWFWLLMSFLLLLFWKKNIFVAALSLSSIFYILPYFIVGQASDFRYIYLSILLVLLGIVALIFSDTGYKAYNE